MKVLLVDDSMTMRKIQKRVLASMGIEDVTEAANGREGLNKLAGMADDLSLILSDINMPVMSGIEFVTRVREHPATKHIPIIMCTSVTEKHQVLAALKAGANGFVVKPFQPEMLQAKIQEFALAK